MRKRSLNCVTAVSFAVVEEGDYAIGPVSFVRNDGTEVRAMDEKNDG